MSLVSGAKLGPYEIQAPLGAGGMGEVYRARDTRLDRAVAIKVLPSHLSASAQVRQRFEREARALSSFAHPHICTLYDVGHESGVDFLVMEFLEGESLAARLEKGQLPTTEALRYAVQIADALDKAHRQGVIHRDLKPGNIVLTKSGAKLLDFGLAKAATSVVAAAIAETVSVGQSAQAQPITSEGTIVGTFQYMAPEQLEGKPADARTDIFAFGAVLYEMATGRKAFTGKSQATIIAAILSSEPASISSLQPMTPSALDRVVKTCLAKDPDERFQTAHDLKLQLQWIAEAGSQAGVPAPVAQRRRTRELLGWVVAAALGIVSALLLAALYSNVARESPSRGVTRFAVPLAKGQELSVDTTVAVALSPDGKKLAYVATENGIPRLYVRSLDEFDAVVVPESEGATFPFFSEDSQWVAFFSHGKLKKAPASAGTPLVICDVPSFAGGAWTPDGRILFTIPGVDSSQVSAAGGIPEKLNITPKGPLARPISLPDGQWILFTHYTERAPEVWALSRRSGDVHAVVSNALSAYYSGGELLYYSSGTIWAAPFDLRNASVTGTAVAVVSHVGEQNLVAEFSASRNGVLAYAPSTGESPGRSLYWVDRKGSARKIDVPGEDYVDPSISPDGKHFVIAVRTVAQQILAVYDVERGVLMRMSGIGGVDASPVWMPDGRNLLFDARGPSQRSGIYRMAADGSTPAQLIRELPANGHVTSISAEGKAIVMMSDAVTSTDLWLLSLEGDHDFRAFRRTPAMERQGSFSPDGRWLAYASNEGGRSEIYVEPVPGPGGRWQISTSGGEQPRWSRNGREIFYRNGTKMMSAAVETTGGFVARKPVELFDLKMDRGGAVPGYDVMPDGKTFLMVKANQPNPTEIRVVVGWPARSHTSAPAN